MQKIQNITHTHTHPHTVWCNLHGAVEDSCHHPSLQVNARRLGRLVKADRMGDVAGQTRRTGPDRERWGWGPRGGTDDGEQLSLATLPPARRLRAC